MTVWQVIALVAGVTLVAYIGFVLWLVRTGRRSDARALAGFLPDCVVLIRRLLGDNRVSRSHKLLLGVMVAYLALPIDLVPDLIPIAGQLDDAILLAVVLRRVLRAAGTDLLTEHWPGPGASLRLLVRLVGQRAAGQPDIGES